MSSTVLALAFGLGGAALSFAALALAKHDGDIMASWVIANEREDGRDAAEFGVDWIESQEHTRSSLRSYGPYVARYRKMKRAAGESDGLATRFEAARIARVAVWGLAITLAVLAPWFLG